MQNLTLTQNEMQAIKILKQAGGTLDYNGELKGFAQTGAAPEDCIRLVVAKDLLSIGVVQATKSFKRMHRQMLMQIKLVEQY